MANDTWNFTERMACTLNVSLYFLPDQEKYNYIVIIRTHIFGSYTEKENKDGNMDKIFLYTKTEIYSNTAIKHAHDTCKTYFNCANIYLYDYLVTQY